MHLWCDVQLDLQVDQVKKINEKYLRVLETCVSSEQFYHLTKLLSALNVK